MFVVPTILVSPDPNKEKGYNSIIYNKVFVLLIPRRSASFPYAAYWYCTGGVGFTCNTEPIGVTFRSMLKSIIEASEVASIGDTRQKELFDLYYLKLYLHQAEVYFKNFFFVLNHVPFS